LLRTENGQLEHATAVGTMIYYTLFTLLGERLGIRSSYLNAFGALTSYIALVINDVFLGAEDGLSIASYFIGQV
jgi:hypothetical protein